MKIRGRINLLCATESGVSKKTGRAWKSKDIVIEEVGEQYPSTFHLHTMNDDVIAKLETCKEGDEATFDIYASSECDEIRRTDGTTWYKRYTTIALRGVEELNESGF